MNTHEKFRIIIPPQDIHCEPGVLQKFANGDREAFEWIYKNYCGKVYDYALMITRNETISEDIVQEVFLKLWKNKERLNEEKNFNGYLYRCYHNHIIDVLRKQKRRLRGNEFYYSGETRFEHSTEELMMKNEWRQMVQMEVKKLPAQQQLVYLLDREYGLKQKDIAKELKLSDGAMRNYLCKAVGKLREALKENLVLL